MLIRELLPPGGKRKERTSKQVADATPLGLDYPATQVGVAGNITVSYDSALGAPGLSIAKQLLGAVTGPYNDMQTFFGVSGGPTQVIVAPLSGNNDGSGGAYHHGCDFTSGGVLYLDATFAAKTVNPLSLEVGLYVAELSECFMGAQNKGWGCGYSNGEGLSRFLAEYETAAGTLNAFATGPAWSSAGTPDWVSKTEQTDQDGVSTGCSIVYIYWMLSLGYSIADIVQAAGATLSANYKTLTGKKTAYADLVAAVKGLSIASDNPFVGPLQLFYTGAGNGVYSIWRNLDGSWAQQQSIGGTVNGGVIVAQIPDTDVLQLFYRGTDNSLYSRWRNADCSWSGEQNLGGVLAGDPIAARVPNTDVLQLFYRGTNNGVYTRWRNPDGSWSNEQSLGGVLSGNPVAAQVPGTTVLQLFYRGTNNGVYTRWRNPDGSWSNEQSLGGVLSGDPIAAPVPVSDVLQLFYRGANDGLYSRWRNADGSWSGEQSLGGTLNGEPMAARVPGTDVLQVFYRGTNNGLYSRWRNPDGSWSNEQSLGGTLSSDPVSAEVPISAADKINKTMTA
jgi:hypothetical protein